MRKTFRRLTALTVGLALAGGAMTATTSPASAAVGDPVQNISPWGMNNGFTIEWNPPVDLTGITSYTVALVPGTDPSATPVDVVTAPFNNTDLESYAWHGLTPGDVYTGWVAVNYGSIQSPRVEGWGYDQVYAQIGKPKNVRVVPGHESLTVKWRAPVATSLTGPIVFYTVFVGDEQYWAPAEDRELTISDLVPGKRYKVTVNAMAGGGDGKTVVRHGRPTS